MGFVLGWEWVCRRNGWREREVKCQDERGRRRGKQSRYYLRGVCREVRSLPPLVGFAYSASDSMLEHDFIVSIHSAVRMCVPELSGFGSGTITAVPTGPYRRLTATHHTLM